MDDRHLTRSKQKTVRDGNFALFALFVQKSANSAMNTAQGTKKSAKGKTCAQKKVQ